MSQINPLAREVCAKIVYYGPGLSGKTTSLKSIHRSVHPDRRGELISLQTEGDRTIFFDYLPISLQRVSGMAVRIQLYTVPGQIFYAATRKLVLNGADGVVFVADSQPAARERNLESLQDLEANLAEFGISLPGFPLVFQYNKRDVPGVMSVEMMEADLNRFGAPVFETAATRGTKVLDALKESMRLVVKDLGARRRQAREQIKSAKSGSSRPVYSADERSEATGADERRTPTAFSRPSDPLSARQPRKEPALSADSVQRPDEGSKGISFAMLWGEDGEGALRTVESYIISGKHGTAVREAASGVARILEALPGSTPADGPMTKAVLLGIGGRAFLRLCDLASQPDEALGEADALFCLHTLVATRLEWEAIKSR